MIAKWTFLSVMFIMILNITKTNLEYHYKAVIAEELINIYYPPETVIYIHEIIDSVKNEVSVIFESSVADKTPPPPSGRNFCSICIINNDSLLMWNGEILNDSSELFKNIQLYYNYIDTTNEFGKSMEEIELLGNVNVTPMVFEITLNLFMNEPINLNTLKSSVNLFNILFQFIIL
jgi:hypothetical protein